MSGVYSRNKLFDSSYFAGKENLPELEIDVHTDESILSSVEENYETSIEEDWPNFIKNLYE
ncbi:MAG: hypothetical protein LBO82_06285 [Synergistaceae bacterium]|nr:hypothetical protein [Synergistaceae bacterium]